MVMVCLTIRMVTGTKVNGEMATSMDLVLIITVLVRCIWATTKRTRDAAGADTSIRTASFTMVIGTMETRKALGAISMETEFTWANAI